MIDRRDVLRGALAASGAALVPQSVLAAPVFKLDPCRVYIKEPWRLRIVEENLTILRARVAKDPNCAGSEKLHAREQLCAAIRAVDRDQAFSLGEQYRQNEAFIELVAAAPQDAFHRHCAAICHYNRLNISKEMCAATEPEGNA